jgi:hypothetical protein
MGEVLALPATPNTIRIKYEDPLRVAAAALAHSAGGEVISTTLVGELSKVSDEDAVEELVTDVADEFDLEAEIHFDGERDSFSVRFTL